MIYARTTLTKEVRIVQAINLKHYEMKHTWRNRYHYDGGVSWEELEGGWDYLHVYDEIFLLSSLEYSRFAIDFI